MTQQLRWPFIDRIATTHNSHPETSQAAAEGLILSGHASTDARDALDLVRRCPGLTGYELDVRAGERVSRRISRRLGGLRASGLLKHGESRVCGVCGKRCVTWYLAGA